MSFTVKHAQTCVDGSYFSVKIIQKRTVIRRNTLIFYKLWNKIRNNGVEWREGIKKE